MFPRVSPFLPLRPLRRLPLPCGSREAPSTATALLASPAGTVRAKNNSQRYFSTNNVAYCKKNEQSVAGNEISETTSKSPETAKENTKKDLLSIIKSMKVELSAANVQTTRPPGQRLPTSVEARAGRPPRAADEARGKRAKPLSPELVAAASAVADSLPFDKQKTKSDLLRQLRQHEEDARALRDGPRPKISFGNIISDMKVTRPAAVRARPRPEHQIQFDEESDSSPEQSADLRKRRDLFKGKRLNIFNIETFTEEEPKTETPPSLWDIEFAKQLAAVSAQPFQNGFEEMIQWTKEGKLWEFPINNEAGFDDDGSEFHEHIFLDQHLEGFPKQGPIRHFMELVTCGLSRNPYLSVRQKVEHIEWFRNYFNEKRDILKESNIQFN
ncbi:28S ribosomal protein S31, mitochondrial-like isoform X3 [Ochotona curzoniae]|uniref:28S ribosomal protein S31, mitochondrial isoform X3 n=1 Tax=Ochotona curzoniae TaxID=130825 RepID=UPI001B34972C|nr:28S ribosomal protein S31, mitochondrial isoform X3 [Ochotona curzoniae]XP_040853746.1 28S ribosomal protein S31, mitochondrial-like isoform X3 [Ochotona curzoniae]